MDRAQLFLVALPLFLFFTDVVNLFSPKPPPPPRPPRHHQHHHHDQQRPVADHHQPDLPSPTLKQGAIGYGTTIDLSFCASCSYRGNAMTMKKMLETYFPGANVVLSNYPPPLPKRLLSKVVPVVQAGVIGIVMAGDRIFPMLGFVAPPSWYFQLRANKFGSMATTWLLGNMVQSFLQSSGAFEVHCNGELVFSKLKEHRFPGELELKDIISRRISSTNLGEDLGKYWSA